MIVDNEHIVKLDKSETWRLLDELCNVNFKYGVLCKLLYLYGKQVSECFDLRMSDIDFEGDCISFHVANNHDICDSYRILDCVVDDLRRLCEDVCVDGFLFVDDLISVRSFSSKVNYYVYNLSDSLFGFRVSVSEFRRLRGQHLLLDGVDVYVVMELFCRRDISAVKRFLCFDELLGVGCFCLDDVFGCFSDF